ncbi:MAG: hypothetical protein PHX51_04265 [Clostridia bacterium]|nr:hypothetical protein [Clostridia bacterium]
MKVYQTDAKLNLSLFVTGRKDDYHLLNTLCLSIALCNKASFEVSACNDIAASHNDTKDLRIEREKAYDFSSKESSSNAFSHIGNKTQFNFIVDDRSLPRTFPHPKDDSSDKFEEFCLEIVRICRISGVKADLIRNIPVASGLGGSSADMANIVKFAADLLKCSVERFRSVYSRFAGDVDILLKGACVAVGKGDVERVLKTPRSYTFVLLFPKLGNITKDVFRAFDDMKMPLTSVEGAAEINRELADIIESGEDMPEYLLRNDLLDSALSINPELRRIFDILKDFRPPCLTGSGSCLFYPVRNLSDATDLRRRVCYLLGKAAATDVDFHYDLLTVNSNCSTAYI